MEMVLVRKPGLLSSVEDDLFACTVVVREAFMGRTSLLTCDLAVRARSMELAQSSFASTCLRRERSGAFFSFTHVDARLPL